jgi:hypothetical protein
MDKNDLGDCPKSLSIRLEKVALTTPLDKLINKHPKLMKWGKGESDILLI